MIMLNKTIRLFLDSIGRREEYEFYLDKFHAAHTTCFALLCPDRASVEDAVEMIAFDLHFLLKLELVPAILLCGNETEAMRKALASEPIYAFKALENNDPSDFIKTCCSQEQVPVLLAPDRDHESVLLDLLPHIAKRVHFIRAAGGLKSTTGEQLPYLYTHKENPHPVEPTEFDYLHLGRTLFDQRPGTHFSVTSSINLLQEIFTVKGAGTLFRKGSTIDHYNGIQAIDRSRLLNLLEASFNKPLSDLSFLDAVTDAYIEEDFLGAVLMEKQPFGHYLSKFAVGREARGKGLALELWREMAANHPAFFWRSNATNPFNSWYSKQADGYHTDGKWQIFWRGVPAQSISDIIELCTSRPEDFTSSSTND